jgi:hypothetical protein
VVKPGEVAVGETDDSGLGLGAKTVEVTIGGWVSEAFKVGAMVFRGTSHAPMRSPAAIPSITKNGTFLMGRIIFPAQTQLVSRKIN